LSEGGTVVNYGLLSGKPCQLTPELVVFQGITLTSFWLAKLLETMKPDELQHCMLYWRVRLPMIIYIHLLNQLIA